MLSAVLKLPFTSFRARTMTHVLRSVTNENILASDPPAKMLRVHDQQPLRVKKLSEHATIPSRGSAFAAGYDLSRSAPFTRQNLNRS